MSDTEQQGDEEFMSSLREVVQSLYNDSLAERWGAGLVGDIAIVFEVHKGTGKTALHQMDSDIPSWRQLGMFDSAMQTIRTLEIVDAVFGPADEHNAPNGDDE